MPDWRIYYDDGSTFGSDQGEPHDAPSEGWVTAVGYDDHNKRYLMHGWDFYRYDIETSQWWGLNLPGLFDALRRRLVYAYVEGRTVSNAHWREITRRAADDPDFPIGGRDTV